MVRNTPYLMVATKQRNRKQDYAYNILLKDTLLMTYFPCIRPHL
jgi:hypothetical protein